MIDSPTTKAGMTEFLDELARSMAKPLPRRRALRLLGGAVLAAAVPGIATTKARAATSFHTCERDGGQLCVCPKGCTDVCSKRCCMPDKFEACGPCAEGKYATCVFKCPDSRKKCGKKCCGVGSECADPDIGYCCEPREQVCKGGKIAGCCKPDEFCCRARCCPRGTRCKPGGIPGECVPCPKGAKKCGKTCCLKGESCCGGKCCSKREKCCPSDICCRKEATCCGEKCCTDKQKCCGDHCCPEQQTCCGDGCCNAGTMCIKRGKQYGCCPEERVAQTPAGAICCPPLWYAEKDTCCPTGRACTPCDPPCPRGQYCQDGYCLQP